MATHKDWRRLIDWAEEQGWKVVMTNGDHLRWEGPHGQLVFSGSTPSDHRALANQKGHLRRAGLPVPHRTNRRKKTHGND